MMQRYRNIVSRITPYAFPLAVIVYGLLLVFHDEVLTQLRPVIDNMLTSQGLIILGALAFLFAQVRRSNVDSLKELVSTLQDRLEVAEHDLVVKDKRIMSLEATVTSREHEIFGLQDRISELEKRPPTMGCPRRVPTHDRFCAYCVWQPVITEGAESDDGGADE